MAPPNKWGPPIWRLFHTLAAKLTNDDAIPQLIAHIRNICSLLPCPDCSQHATDFWSRTKCDRIKTKADLVYVLYVFHETVNKRLKKQPFDKEMLARYESLNLQFVYKEFVSAFVVKGNMNALNESFRRQMVLKRFGEWINSNHFLSNRNV
jgi:hypothetical protein